jgi:hypothetical protein
MEENQKVVCDFRAQLVKFLEQINVETIGVLCPNLNLNRNFIEFDPSLESRDLLKQWLQYRGHPDIPPEPEEVEKEMKSHGNFPSFSAFTNFNPETVSTDFLQRWMSWYGVTSFQPKDHTWWSTRAKKLQTMLLKTHEVPKTTDYLKKNLEEVKKLQFLIAETNEFFFKLNISFNKLTDEELQQVIQTPTSVETAWDSKKLLAVALDASAIAIPMLISQNKTMQSKLKMFAQAGKPTGTSLEKFQESMKQKTQDQVKYTMVESIVEHLIGKKTSLPIMSLGKALARDVSRIITRKDQVLPESVISGIASRYLSKHPFLLLGITNIIIPSINVAFEK